MPGRLRYVASTTWHVFVIGCTNIIFTLDFLLNKPLCLLDATSLVDSASMYTYHNVPAQEFSSPIFLKTDIAPGAIYGMHKVLQYQL